MTSKFSFKKNLLLYEWVVLICECFITSEEFWWLYYIENIQNVYNSGLAGNGLFRWNKNRLGTEHDNDIIFI